MIVDFWATWCGPCKTLGPALEKAVLAAKGAVKLVKIDIDKNPVFAGQLRVQSIPTVYAFVDGRPVDGFMGAVPESQIKAFIDRLVQRGGGAAARRSTSCWRMAKESLELGDIGGAAQAFAAGAAGRAGQPARPSAASRAATWPAAIPSARREVAAMAPADAKNADLESVRAALALAAGRAVRHRRVRAAPGRRPGRPRGAARAGQGARRPRRVPGARPTSC